MGTGIFIFQISIDACPPSGITGIEPGDGPDMTRAGNDATLSCDPQS